MSVKIVSEVSLIFHRVALEQSSSCDEAITVMKETIEKHGSDELNVNFLVCDKNGAFSVNVNNKEITSEKIDEPFKSLSEGDWPVDAPSEGFDVTNMFQVLRKAATDNAKSSFVSKIIPSDGPLDKKYKYLDFR